MELLTTTDIALKNSYEQTRSTWRRHVMVQKDKRRVFVGEHCSVHFENRDTMLYQVQEMLRTENSWERPGAMEEELSAYNPLIPQTGELSATLMFEYATEAERREALQQLVGIDQHVWLHIGDTAPVQATFDLEQIEAQKVSSVHYIKWPLPTASRQALKRSGTVVRLVIDHPHYTEQAVLSEDTRRAIRQDPD